MKQEKKVEELPACQTCWQEVIDNKIKILNAKPIVKKQEEATK